MTRPLFTPSPRHPATPALLLCLLLSACAPEEKVTHYKPFFTGIGGADFGAQGPVDPSRGRADPAATGAMKTVIEKDDGTKVYIARAPVQLMAHVENLLDESSAQADTDLLEQLVDVRTKEHYRSQGKDPSEFVRMLHKRRRDVAVLFARMPMGENSPTVLVDQPGDRMWVIKLTGQAAEGAKLKELWVRFDLGQWRLVNVR